MQSAVTCGLVSGVSKISCSVAVIVLLSQQRVPGRPRAGPWRPSFPPGPNHASAPACRPLREFSHCYLFRHAARSGPDRAGGAPTVVSVTDTWQVEPSGPLRGEIGARGAEDAGTQRIVAALV